MHDSSYVRRPNSGIWLLSILGINPSFLSHYFQQNHSFILKNSSLAITYISNDQTVKKAFLDFCQKSSFQPQAIQKSWRKLLIYRQERRTKFLLLLEEMPASPSLKILEEKNLDSDSPFLSKVKVTLFAAAHTTWTFHKAEEGKIWAAMIASFVSCQG